MKLVLAIINNDDSPIVTAQLTKAGFNMTKVASTGGFLMSGNTTFISGVEDDKVDEIISIISKFSKKRLQPSVAHTGSFPATADISQSTVQEVLVGGGTIFVLNVERFEHV
jgi:uncharacterized protein YaaQ